MFLVRVEERSVVVLASVEDSRKLDGLRTQFGESNLENKLKIRVEKGKFNLSALFGNYLYLSASSSLSVSSFAIPH